jgi:membrane protein
VFVSLYGLFADISTVAVHLALLSQILPPGAVELLAEQMIRVATTDHSSLSLALVLSVMFALWSANSGMGALFGGLNTAYGVTERRPWLRLNMVSLTGTVFGVGVLSLLAAVTGVLPGWLAAHGLMTSEVIRLAAGEALLFVVITAGLAALYRFGPSHAGRNWRCYWPGALLAAVLWLAASVAYSAYVNNFAHYEKTYGSLGAIVGFMMWLWLSSLAILTGAELNAEIEKQALAGAAA